MAINKLTDIGNKSYSVCYMTEQLDNLFVFYDILKKRWLKHSEHVLLNDRLCCPLKLSKRKDGLNIYNMFF